MAESEAPLIIPVVFDLSQPEQGLERLEERARRGITVETRASEGAAGGAVRRGGTTPPPAVGGGPVVAFQEEVNRAWARGDTATASRIAGQASSLGIPVQMPGAGGPVLSRGGFAPLAGQMFTSPIGPRAPGDVVDVGAQMRSRAEEHAAELSRQQQSRANFVTSRVFAHAEEFARQDRARQAAAASLRERAEEHAEEFARQQASRANYVTSRVYEHAEEFARQDRARADAGAAMRGRAFAHAEEFERRERSRAGMGMALRGRAEEHAEEFARRDRARADAGMALRERAEAHAEEFARQDRVVAQQQRRAEQVAAGGLGGGNGWRFTPGMSNMQRLRAVGNTQLLGMGQYMNLMFGGWEVAGSMNAQAAAERFASANPGDLQGQMRAWNTALDRLGGGILGSVVSMPFQGRREQIDAMAAQAMSADQRMAAQETSRVFRLGLSQQAGIGAAAGGTRLRRQADAQYENTLLESKSVHDAEAETVRRELGQKAARWAATREGRSNRLMAEMWATSDPSKVTGDEVRAEAFRRVESQDRDLLAGERERNEARIREKRDQAQKLAERIRATQYQDAQVADRAMRLTGSAAVFGAQGMDYAAQLALIATGGAGDPIAARIALAAGNQREVALALARQQGSAAASGFARSGQPRAAAMAAIDAQLGYQNGTFLGLPDTSNPLYGEQLRAATEQRNEAIRSAEAADIRRRAALSAQQRATELNLARNPLGAQMAMIGGAFVGDVQDIGLGGAARNAWGRIRAAVQERDDQTQLIGINQAGRAAQIAALMNRDPTSANVAGIVANARAEEASLRQRGFAQEADRARQLGIDSLRLERQNYLDSFGGVETSRNFALSLRPKDAEDPATVLRNIENGILGLGQPGTVSDGVPGWFQPLLDKLDELRGLITN